MHSHFQFDIYLATGTDVSFLRQNVAQLAFALIAPLGTEDNGHALRGHASGL